MIRAPLSSIVKHRVIPTYPSQKSHLYTVDPILATDQFSRYRSAFFYKKKTELRTQLIELFQRTRNVTEKPTENVHTDAGTAIVGNMFTTFCKQKG